MVRFQVRLRLDESQRTRVLKTLHRILSPTRLLPGCISCHLYSDVEEAKAFVLDQEWQTKDELVASLCNDSFRVVLAAIDCSSDPPDVRFETISETQGMEFIVACRGPAPVE